MLQMWRLIATPVLLGFLILGAYLYFYLGANQPVVVERRQVSGMNLLFKVHRGPYHHINQVIETVEKWAKENNYPCPRTFGEYLDDPRQVPQERLTSNGGCVSETPYEAANLPEGYQVKTLPAADYIHATFDGSPAIGPWRVYPKLAEFAVENKLRTAPSTIEIYTVLPDSKMKTEYLVPILDPAE